MTNRTNAGANIESMLQATVLPESVGVGIEPAALLLANDKYEDQLILR